MASHADGVPAVLVHHVDRLQRAPRERSSSSPSSPRVCRTCSAAKRATVEALGGGFHRVVGTYGFMETPDVPALLREAKRAGLDVEHRRRHLLPRSRDDPRRPGRADGRGRGDHLRRSSRATPVPRPPTSSSRPVRSSRSARRSTCEARIRWLTAAYARSSRTGATRSTSRRASRSSSRRRCCRSPSAGRSTRSPARRSRSASPGSRSSCPGFLLALPGGHVADRRDRRKILLVCHLGVAVVRGRARGASRSAGTRSLLPIYAVLVVLGAIRAFSGPAGQALMPSLVERKELERAVALGSSTLAARDDRRPVGRRRPLRRDRASAAWSTSRAR